MTIQETLKAGIYLSVNRDGQLGDQASVPDGTFAVIATANSEWFTVDTAGNVRGNPEGVEQECLAMGIEDNLLARCAVGLARLAMRSRR